MWAKLRHAFIGNNFCMKLVKVGRSYPIKILWDT